MGERLIFHIDVNSAYLSWTAADLLEKGYELDIRTVPAVVGGNEASRHGIVLAKSIPAKKFNIKTGDSLMIARGKCKNLKVVPPHYDLFLRCSNAMVKVLEEYTNRIQRFSCDECFLDFTGMENLYPDPIKLAHEIKDRVKSELGFTVNIGISTNKLLAKVASDFTKPNRVHTLWKHEIEKKMWGLNVGDLFGVGSKTLKKLNNLNIHTVADLAKYDVKTLKYHLKSYGVQLWQYANGIEYSAVREHNHPVMKGLGNSTTTAFDITSREEAHLVIRSLCETLCTRLRNSSNNCSVVCIHYKTNSFFTRRKQRKLSYYTDCTQDIIKEVLKLFDELWEGEKLRQIGVHISDLKINRLNQISIWEVDTQKKKAIDKTVDNIRQRFGKNAIYNASFLNIPIPHMQGGIGEDDYPLMSSRI